MTATLAPTNRPLAGECARTCELSDAALALLSKEIKVPQYLAQLARNNLWNDAINFSPFGLGRVEAVWWGTLCLWQHYRPAPLPDIDACLKAIVAWVREPSDGARHIARQAGNVAGATTPAGVLATAVFFSEGSISLPGRPEVLARPEHLPKMVGQAVMLAVRQSPRDLVAARQADYIRLTMEIFAGRWPLPAAE